MILMGRAYTGLLVTKWERGTTSDRVGLHMIKFLYSVEFPGGFSAVDGIFFFNVPL